MNLCTKQYIREVISRNTKSKVSFSDDDILLLSEISPVEYCGALIELQQTYNMSIYADSILGKDLETVNAIHRYILYQQKAHIKISGIPFTNNAEGGD